MAPHWMLCWHEDREISPGVPDLHYIPKSDEDHRVGWLELKALDVPLSKNHRIKVEPSQHQFIRKWRPYMPIHFLIRIKGDIFLIDGSYHAEIPMAAEISTLMSLSVKWFHQDDTVEVLPGILKTITRI